LRVRGRPVTVRPSFCSSDARDVTPRWGARTEYAAVRQARGRRARGGRLGGRRPVR
jgi:hypothetical protein